ncbi:hypothetical protein [Domibacillus tundrae]|uniref:hypothetical protein n=1 Tax=Domibacillus tundrae TaxID=1587527 RepID=UPI00339B8C73
MKKTFKKMLIPIMGLTLLVLGIASANTEAANKALDQNAVDMTPAVAAVYGKEGAAEFERKSYTDPEAENHRYYVTAIGAYNQESKPSEMTK